MHPATTVASVRQESGRGVARSILPTEESAIGGGSGARATRGGDRGHGDELTERLRLGGLRAVYHGNVRGVQLKELSRAYQNLVEDTTRVMLRLRPLFRARGIWTPGQGVYQPQERTEWLAQMTDRGPGSEPRSSRPGLTCYGRSVPGPGRRCWPRPADDLRAQSELQPRGRGCGRWQEMCLFSVYYKY